MLNWKLVLPESAPAAASGFQSARACTVQLAPGGKASSKSNTQLRSLVQRPLCAVADGGTPRQLSVTGSGKVGSPNGTTACA